MQGRAPRQVLLDALNAFENDTNKDSLNAIDLGCGDGTESAVLLERGWNVLAIDSEPGAIKRLMEKVPGETQVRLQTQIAKFEDIQLPRTDLIYASFSIPFCHPDHFQIFWNKVVNAIQPGPRDVCELRDRIF